MKHLLTSQIWCLCNAQHTTQFMPVSLVDSSGDTIQLSGGYLCTLVFCLCMLFHHWYCGSSLLCLWAQSRPSNYLSCNMLCLSSFSEMFLSGVVWEGGGSRCGAHSELAVVSYSVSYSFCPCFVVCAFSLTCIFELHYCLKCFYIPHNLR
jgi:hypothetical protein